MNINSKTKIALGAVLATFSATGSVFLIQHEWTITSHPWGFLIVFMVGILAGLGAALAVKGLIERRFGS